MGFEPETGESEDGEVFFEPKKIAFSKNARGDGCRGVFNALKSDCLVRVVPFYEVVQSPEAVHSLFEIGSLDLEQVLCSESVRRAVLSDSAYPGGLGHDVLSEVGLLRIATAFT